MKKIVKYKYLINSIIIFLMFFTSIEKVFAADITKTAAETLISKNEMVNEKGYRYEGKNPNNYVTFNDELWRIIGVFETVNADTKKTEQLVKIIRNDSIGKIIWNTEKDSDYGYNWWPGADIRKILNEYYYNGKDINYTYPDSKEELANYNTVSISGVSLKSTAQSMVQNAMWYMGGANDSKITADEFYIAERTKNTENFETSYKSMVGLMYPSDYGYAADKAFCPRTTELMDYDDPNCVDNNWIYNNIYEWTITPQYGAWINIFSVEEYLNSFGYDTNGVRPTVYLKSNVGIVDNGNDGSKDKPYDLGYVSEKIEIPKLEVKNATENSVTLNISVPNHTGDDSNFICYVYRSTSENGDYTKISDAGVNCSKPKEITDSNLKSSTTYYYKAQIKDSDTYSEVVSVKTKAAVTNDDATPNADDKNNKTPSAENKNDTTNKTDIENPNTGISLPIVGIIIISIIAIIVLIYSKKKKLFHKI